MKDIIFFTEFKDIGNTFITDFGALRKQGDDKMAAFIQEIGKR